MAKKIILTALSLIVLFSMNYACSESEDKRQETAFRQIPEIAEVKPQKPVKIKLKRGNKGDYSWELTGDDANEVLEADKKLKESLVEPDSGSPAKK